VRLLYTLLLFLHLAGVVVWVGGMFVLHFAVSPAAVAAAPAQRLPLLANALGRFFYGSRSRSARSWRAVSA
jgi:uncharacterized membrane protein